VNPLGLAPEEITRVLCRLLDEKVVATSTAFAQASVCVRPDAWVEAVRLVRDTEELQCDFFSFLSAVEWSFAESEADATKSRSEESADTEEMESVYREPEEACFQVLCRLQSTTLGHGLTLKTSLEKDSPRIDSLIPVFGGADWHEREMMEMFGIEVIGHPNPAKLYLPDAFEGHPLRRDFKLASREVKPWPGDVDVEDMPEDAPVIDPSAQSTAKGGVS